MKYNTVASLMVGLCLTVLLPLFINGQEKVAANENDGATRVFDEATDEANPTRVLYDARTYLRRAWKNKENVTLKVVRYSREGVQTTCDFAVESGVGGKRRIVVKCRSKGDPWGPGSSPPWPSKPQVFDRLTTDGPLADDPRVPDYAVIVLTKVGKDGKFIL